MKLFKLIAFSITALLGYLFFWPVTIEPYAWTPPKLETKGSYNETLKGIEKLSPGVGIGPEGISFDRNGRIYAGFSDGRIMRFQPDGSQPELLARTGGRPWGTHAEPDGDVVYVADALKGLLRIRSGTVEPLATSADGVPFKLTDDVDRATDGTLYFSDASYKYGLDQMLDDVLEHGHYGRLLSYDIGTGKTKTLMNGLHVANGVAVGPDDAYVLVSETLKYRVTRYWLKGEGAGTSEPFIENLPGFPDNISYNGRDGYWLALFAPRDSVLDALLPHPWLRKVIYRLPEALHPKAVMHARVLKLDMNGKVVADLQYKGDDVFAPITSVREVDGWLYFGSIEYPAIGRMRLPASLGNAPVLTTAH